LRPVSICEKQPKKCPKQIANDCNGFASSDIPNRKFHRYTDARLGGVTCDGKNGLGEPVAEPLQGVCTAFILALQSSERRPIRTPSRSGQAEPPDDAPKYTTMGQPIKAVICPF